MLDESHFALINLALISMIIYSVFDINLNEFSHSLL